MRTIECSPAILDVQTDRELGRVKNWLKGQVDLSKKRWWREGGGGEFSFFLPAPAPLVFQLLSRNLWESLKKTVCFVGCMRKPFSNVLAIKPDRETCYFPHRPPSKQNKRSNSQVSVFVFLARKNCWRDGINFVLAATMLAPSPIRAKPLGWKEGRGQTRVVTFYALDHVVPLRSVLGHAGYFLIKHETIRGSLEKT